MNNHILNPSFEPVFDDLPGRYNGAGATPLRQPYPCPESWAPVATGAGQAGAIVEGGQ